MKSPLFTWIQFFQFYLPLLPTFHPLLPIGCACPLNNDFLAFPTCCHFKVVFAPEVSSPRLGFSHSTFPERKAMNGEQIIRFHREERKMNFFRGWDQN